MAGHDRIRPAGGRGQKKDVVFYNGQIKTAEFFISTVIPVTLEKMDAIQGFSPAAIEMEDDALWRAL